MYTLDVMVAHRQRSPERPQKCPCGGSICWHDREKGRRVEFGTCERCSDRFVHFADAGLECDNMLKQGKVTVSDD